MMIFFPIAARKALQAVVISGFLLMGASAGFCADDPINIVADRMISQEEQNSVVFIGNVDASQGPVTIRTDEMTVHYVQNDVQNDKQNDSTKEKKQSSKVKKLICIGNVEVTQEDWLGTGKRMDYFAIDRKVILTGDAKAWQGQNMVAGKTIIYYLDEKRSIVEAEKSKPGEGSGRVSATLQQ